MGLNDEKAESAERNSAEGSPTRQVANESPPDTHARTLRLHAAIDRIVTRDAELIDRLAQ